MANLNKVLLMGNITRDPAVTYLPATQMPVCDFGLAINRTWTGQDGVKKEEVTFVDCTAFGKTAELLAKYKKKGDPLFVEGRLKLDQWQAPDGTNRSKLKVTVENFQFLNRAPTGGYGGPQTGVPPEYSGEPTNAPAPRPVQRPAYNRPPVGRPAPATQQPAAQPAPNYDVSDVPPATSDDAPPPIPPDDIPF
ncbi:MAG: single-stranded DNA-binding protein [Phycisphaerales bacterium]|nr:single-stranded DNA-binding protein [Phycisphaerales bacterium]